MYPTVALSYGKIVSRDYAVVVCKAYNDWLSDTYLKFNSRFKGMGIIPMQDPEEAAKELRRAVTELTQSRRLEDIRARLLALGA